MSKRIGELIVSTPSKGSMLSTAVRFGNVLGSRGSVVPTFTKQIDMGGPVTLTHADMTRYFLSIAEAVSLVIQAAAITQGGDLYVLDMGVPVSIADLAQRMIRARGLRPGQDIAIEYVGPRPGEKMSEELVGVGEAKIATEYRSIFQIQQHSSTPVEHLSGQIDDLLSFSMNGATVDQVRTRLRDCVESLSSVSS
jgi:FlaA1/EpsC-like NDP-sugar epimerase